MANAGIPKLIIKTIAAIGHLHITYSKSVASPKTAAIARPVQIMNIGISTRSKSFAMQMKSSTMSFIVANMFFIVT